MKKKQKPKYNLVQCTGFMAALAWKNKKSTLFLCIALAVLPMAQSLLKLLFAPMILNRVEIHASLRSLLLTILFFTLGLFLLQVLFDAITNIAHYNYMDLRVLLRRQVQEKLSRTSYPRTEDPDFRKHTESVYYSLKKNSSSTQKIWTSLSDLGKNLLGFLLYLLLLSSLNPMITCVTIITAILSWIVSSRVSRWYYAHKAEEAELVKRMEYVRRSSIKRQLAKDVRIFGMASWLNAFFRSAEDAFHAFVARRERRFFLINLTDAFLVLLRNGIAYAYLIHLTLAQGLPASVFLLYFSSVEGFNNWITGILNTCVEIYQHCLEISYLREYLEAPEPFRFTGGTKPALHFGTPPGLALRDVSFQYPGTEERLFSHLNLTIAPGEKLAIVGLNGAGKTTLVKLLCGLYDPLEGSVCFNGTDIREYNRDDYYQQFSAVFQQFSLLDATLAENVAQCAETDPDFDMGKVKACVEKAGLSQKIESLPQGYHTPIGREIFENGVELSGGETQRLMLARALYKDSPVIMLDEPTAALDPIAENDIYLRYNEMTAGHTSLYISHRLASTRFCDRILYLEKGCILEEGTHEELMAKQGKYAQLFELQSRYYRENGTELPEEGDGI